MKISQEKLVKAIKDGANTKQEIAKKLRIGAVDYYNYTIALSDALQKAKREGLIVYNRDDREWLISQVEAFEEICEFITEEQEEEQTKEEIIKEKTGHNSQYGRPPTETKCFMISEELTSTVLELSRYDLKKMLDAMEIAGVYKIGVTIKEV